MRSLINVVFICLIPFFAYAQVSKEIDSLLNLAELQKDSAKAITEAKIGNRYVRKGMFDSGLFYYNSVLKYGEKINSLNSICLAKLEMGKIYIRRSEYTKALDIFFDVLRIAGSESKYTGHAKLNIGFVYLTQKKPGDALQFLFDAEKELLVSRDTINLFGVYSYLPMCIGKSGDTTKALIYYRKGFDLYDAYGLAHGSSADQKEFLDRNRVVLLYNRLDFLTHTKDIEEDLKRAELIWERAKLSYDNTHKFEVLSLLGNLTISLKRFGETIFYGNEALKLHVAGTNYNQLTDIYWMISEAAAGLGQYKEAHRNLLLFKQYNDSLFETSQLEAIHSVEAKYETEKKEQKILSLKKEKKAERIILYLILAGFAIAIVFFIYVLRANRLQKKLFQKEREIQKRKQEQRMAELEQTALRAQMNPHFIFNCLNSVQRFVGKDEKNEVNLYLTTFASLIRQTLENSGKTLILLKDELAYLETYIKVEQMRSRDSFDYDIQVDENIDLNEVMIPNMLIQPFVENSIKHGFNRGGEKRGKLKLAVSRESKLIFVVEDNGPGIKDMAGQPAISEPGHQSMGSSLTEKRIDLYNALHNEKINFTVSDKSGTDKMEQGTRVTLEFPVETE